MAKAKLSVEMKREAARKVILDAAMELFITKGYDKTTTRDIVAKAGILNGSLYNRFKGKDDILICLVKEAVEAILEGISQFLKEDKDILVATALPGTIQIYLASRSKRISDILYHIHTNWAAVETYIELNVGWINRYMAEQGFKLANPEQSRLVMASIIGSVGNIIGLYSNGDSPDYRMVVKHHLQMVSHCMGIPMMDPDGTVDKLDKILESGNIVFLGHDLKKELPELS